MKRKWMIIPALLLVVAGMVMVGCGNSTNSEPTLTWTVTFDTNGYGPPTWTSTVNRGTAIAKPADPTSENYDFVGWFTVREPADNATPFDFTTKITANTTLYAKWTVKEGVTSWTVTFDMGGYATNITREVVDGDKVREPSPAPTSTNPNFVFAGWYEDEDFETEFDFDTEITEDTTIYAKWEDNTPPSIGGNLGPVTVTNNATQKGWATNGTDNIETDLDIVTLINAQYLKLVLGSKPVGGMQIIWQGDGDGWNWNQTAISSDVGVFDASKGAVWDEATKTLTIELSLALANYAALKDSYKAKLFIAYYSTNFDSLGIVSADLIASANPINFVFVTFDADGGDFNDDPDGDPIETVVVRSIAGSALGDKFPANPLKEGYALEKWVNASGTVYTRDTVINANVTLTAVWKEGEPDKWEVSFNTDGGTPTTIAPIEVSDGSAIGAQLPADPTKAGNIFAGWFDAATMTTEYKNTTPAITGDTALKAKWTAIVYPPEPDKEYESPAYLKLQALAIDSGNSLDDWAIGKGYIKGADLAAIKAAPAGSIIVFYAYTYSEEHKGWGLGAINNVQVSITTDVPEETFFTTVSVASLNIDATATEIFVNPWDGVVQRLELWEPNPDYVPPLGLTLYENGAWEEGFTPKSMNYDDDDHRQDIEFDNVNVSAYTTIFIQLKDDFDPNGYFAGGVGGFPVVGEWDWTDVAEWGGWTLTGKTASMSLDVIKVLGKITFKGNNNPAIENVEKIWLE